jgi:hypothetical protein
LAADAPDQPERQYYAAAACGNLAVLRLGQRDFKGAREYLEKSGPHHAAAVQANPKHPEYRRCCRNNLIMLIVASAGLGEQAGAKQAAEKLRDVGFDPPGNAYDAACALSRCIPLVRNDDRVTKEEVDRRVRFYGDEAVRMIRDAVAKGYRNAGQMDRDTALNPLRQRADFKELLAELKTK